MWNKSVALCVILDDDFALKKICGDYIVNHLIRNLSKLEINKLLIGDFPDTYQAPIQRLNVDASFNTVSFLKKIKLLSKAKKIILLPANCLHCDVHVLKKVLSLVKNHDAVIAHNRNTKSHKIIAFNCDKLGDDMKISELLNNNIKVAKITIDADEFNVIDSAKKLINAENKMQNNLREKAINDGVFLLDPNTTYLSFDSKIAPGVTIHPNVVVGVQVIIEKGCSIFSFSHIEGVHVGPDCVIGPFARIRPETKLGMGSTIGNFVEIKNSKISECVKIKHLSYIGDTKIGGNTNISAGVVICNYDGHTKHGTTIDKNCFIGANSSLISPLYIAERVRVGAGSTITDSIEEKNSLAIARTRQVIKITEE